MLSSFQRVVAPSSVITLVSRQTRRVSLDAIRLTTSTLPVTLRYAFESRCVHRQIMFSRATEKFELSSLVQKPSGALQQTSLPSSPVSIRDAMPADVSLSQKSRYGLDRARTESFASALIPSSSSVLNGPGRKRRIPWAEPAAAESVVQVIDNSTTGWLEKTEGSRRSKKSKFMDDESSVRPLATPRAKSTQPWDKTQSAIKDEQKRLRQTKKKLVKVNEATDVSRTEAASDRKKKAYQPIFLSEEQRRVISLVVDQSKSVFFTGSAGTGKSVLLRELISQLRTKYRNEPDRIAVTASTGLAACNIGGVTLHSFSGIGLGKEAASELVKKIRKNQKAKNRWLRTKVLIVDEVSMVDGDLFDKLEEVARTIRKNPQPFGGIKLVITGDFFQLPPVPDNGSGRSIKFAFEAEQWPTSVDRTIGLTQVFRQKDPGFAGMLNEMRLGRLSSQSVDTFRSLSRPIHYDDGIDATELFPTRNEVERANRERMQNLQGRTETFYAVDGGAIKDEEQRSKLLSNCMAPKEITLKEGAQVMLIKNMDESLVNGSLGKVTGFMDEKEFELHHYGRFDAPHGPNGDIDDDGSGMPSRMKMKPPTITTTGRKWPVVCFQMADGTSREMSMSPESWTIELPNGEVQASRSQVPLILAWALSIHKAQGQTLERVKVDLGKVFEKGQAYVALSRATCQEGLQVLRFDPSKVMAHEKVMGFYRSLYGVDYAMSMETTKPKRDTERDQNKMPLAPPPQAQSQSQRTLPPSAPAASLMAVKSAAAEPEFKRPLQTAVAPQADEFGSDDDDDDEWNDEDLHSALTLMENQP